MGNLQSSAADVAVTSPLLAWVRSARAAFPLAQDWKRTVETAKETYLLSAERGPFERIRVELRLNGELVCVAWAADIGDLCEFVSVEVTNAEACARLQLGSKAFQFPTD